jgi:hypothetical protein
MLVSNVALTSNVATLTVTIVEGNLPAVGSNITVNGTVTASGAFNVTLVALTAVSISASTGQGTVSFALTHANVSSTADAGIAIVEQPIVFETVSTNELSVVATLPDSQDGKALSGFSVEVLWASGTSAGAVSVLCSDGNSNGGDFNTVDTITYPATRSDPAGLSANFVQAKISTALTGASTIAVRLLTR